MCLGTSPLLTGRVSKELRDTLDKATDSGHHIQTVKVFSKFLSVSLPVSRYITFVCVVVCM